MHIFITSVTHIPPFLPVTLQQLYQIQQVTMPAGQELTQPMFIQSTNQTADGQVTTQVSADWGCLSKSSLVHRAPDITNHNEGEEPPHTNTQSFHFPSSHAILWSSSPTGLIQQSNNKLQIYAS